MTKYREIPIRIYNIVHTGPNTQFGGVSGGFIKVVYHDEIEDIEAIEPANPASKGTAIQAIRRPGERSECMFIGRQASF
ncbi:MAG: hypothetical protein NTV68_04870 [Methanomicrobiales archaeon]|nr:hypothetical protein [Methanomicrobiales archaeon]